MSNEWLEKAAEDYASYTPVSYKWGRPLGDVGDRAIDLDTKESFLAGAEAMRLRQDEAWTALKKDFAFALMHSNCYCLVCKSIFERHGIECMAIFKALGIEGKKE